MGERRETILGVGFPSSDIAHAIRRRIRHGHYASSTLYGDGRVSERIAAALAGVTPYCQKRLHYANEMPEVLREVEYAGVGNHHGAEWIEGNSKEEYRAVDGQAAAGLHG
jgi:hypothetical protein